MPRVHNFTTENTKQSNIWKTSESHPNITAKQKTERDAL